MAVPPVVDQNFNPRAPCGARRASFSRRLRAYLFQPTRPLRGATILGLGPGPSSSRRFQPTRPLRGATVLCGGDGQWLNYFNPRAPCGARLHAAIRDVFAFQISTHAPLAGRDNPCNSSNEDKDNKFQPTRPLRGATKSPKGSESGAGFQPTRPLRGATKEQDKQDKKREFQPTRPLRGATCSVRDRCHKYFIFQPTRPLRGATAEFLNGNARRLRISTHAPLAGRDSKSVQITMHIFAITDKFQMLLHRMPPVRAFCSFLMQENHADFGCEPPK